MLSDSGRVRLAGSISFMRLPISLLCPRESLMDGTCMTRGKSMRDKVWMRVVDGESLR